MENKWEFRYSIPKHPEGTRVALTAAQAERLLLARLKDEGENRMAVLWELGRFYCTVKKYEKALGCLREIVAATEDFEQKAACVLAMGQAMEQAGDYGAAVRFYREAFALEPLRTHTWYFINNNLGFCLNRLGQPAEGETCCRAAIDIDPTRPNAHKNLGISLAAQARFREAAHCFVQATKVDASDGRSTGLLRDLLAQRQELCPEFQPELERCEKAVRFAAEAVKRTRAEGSAQN